VKQRLWLLTRSAFFALVIPGSVLYYLPHIAGAFAHARSGQWLALALVPIVFGGALLLYCIFEFAWVGLGTLAIIDPPRLLVGRGPYRYVRNPMYLGVVSVLIGEAIAFRSRFLPGYALAFLICVSLFVRFYEEPTLREKFGDSYRQYCATVPRWLPRLPRSPTQKPTHGIEA
jgi:protein-S-isoprenylcysteine O-methyltransferase Ste14